MNEIVGFLSREVSTVILIVFLEQLRQLSLNHLISDPVVFELGLLVRVLHVVGRVPRKHVLTSAHVTVLMLTVTSHPHLAILLTKSTLLSGTS